MKKFLSPVNKTFWLSLSVFIVLIYFYSRTLLPTVGFWDTGEFQTIPYTFDIGHPTGYPTYILFGKIFLLLVPFKSIAWRMNIFSALSSVIGCIFLALLIYQLTKNYLFSFLGGILFGFNKIVWETSLRADSHSLHLFFTSVLLLLIFVILKNKKPICLKITSLILGLAVGNHMLSIFIIPIFILGFIFISNLKKFDWQLAIKTFLLFILGCSVYLVLPLIALQKPPLTIDYNVATWEGFKRLISGGDFQSLMKTWSKGTAYLSLRYYLNILNSYFPYPGILISIIGLIYGFKNSLKFNFLLLALFLLTVGFSLRYQNAVLERYFITSLYIITIWLFIGLNYCRNLFNKIVRIKQKYRLFINFIFGIPIIILIIYNIANNFNGLDQSKNYSAHEFAQETFNNILPNGVIISWWSYSTPLWYLQKVESIRKDVQIYNLSHYQWEAQVEKEISNKPVYLIEAINFDNKNLLLKQTGNIYQVTRQ